MKSIQMRKLINFLRSSVDRSDDSDESFVV